MGDKPAFHQRTVDGEVKQVISDIKDQKVDDARVRLAEDYLTMSSSDFHKILRNVQAEAEPAKLRRIYTEKVDGVPNGKDVYIDDTINDDTRLIGIFADVKPKTAPVSDQNLERAATRFQNLLGVQVNYWKGQATNSDRKYGTDYAAVTALTNYARSLPEDKAGVLLSRAEEINLELGRINRARLNVITADLNGDGTASEVKTVRFTIPFSQGGRGYIHLYTEFWPEAPAVFPGKASAKSPVQSPGKR